MSDGPEALPPEIADLVERARVVPEVPSAARERAFDRLMLRVGLAPASSAPGIGRKVATTLARNARIATVAFALGGVAGAAIHAAATRGTGVPPAAQRIAPPIEAPTPTPMDSPPRTTTPSRPSLPTTIAAPVAPGAIAAPVHVVQRSPISQPTDVDPDERLRAENVAVETVRTAVSRRDYSAALAAAREYRRRFAQRTLDEEVDALTIEALVGAGHSDEARAARDRFVRRYPQSLFRTRIEAATHGD